MGQRVACDRCGKIGVPKAAYTNVPGWRMITFFVKKDDKDDKKVNKDLCPTCLEEWEFINNKFIEPLDTPENKQPNGQ